MPWRLPCGSNKGSGLFLKNNIFYPFVFIKLTFFMFPLCFHGKQFFIPSPPGTFYRKFFQRLNHIFQVFIADQNQVTPAKGP
jgi:hypothetical protein